MTTRKDRYAKPYQRSKMTLIKQLTMSLFTNTSAPADVADGIDVSEWLAILVVVHPTSVVMTDAGVSGAIVRLRPWFYMKAAEDGSDRISGSGQWYSETDFNSALDGYSVNGAMRHILTVNNAEKFYPQVIMVTDPEGSTPVFGVGIYGLGPKYGENPDAFESVAAGVAAAAATGTGDVNLIEIDGTVVDADAGSASLGTLRVIYADDSPGIGEHDAATDDPGFRALAVATTADPAAVADQDDVHLITTTTGRLIIAGYNRTGDHLEVALVSESLGLGVHDTATETDGMRGLAVATNVDPADVANQDDVHMVATLDGKLIIAGYDRLGDLVRIQETDPINYHIAWDVIEESSMGTAASPFVYYLDLDTYYRMSLQIDVTLGSAAAGGVALTTLGTVEDDDPDLTARNYVDMTNAWTGSASITVDAILTDTNGFWGNFTAVKLNVAVVNASNDSAIKIDTKRHVGG